MAIAFDSAVMGTITTGSLTIASNPVGTPRAAFGYCVNWAVTADNVTGATYGGVGMTEVTNSPLIKATGETGVVHGFFLGSSVPTGIQNLVFSASASTGSKQGVIILLTAANDCSVQNTTTISQDTGANPSVSLTLSGNTCFVCIGFGSGQGAITGITPLTGWTSMGEDDFGAGTCGFYRYDTIGSTDVTCGYTATTDDCILLAVAIKENAGGGGATEPPRTHHHFTMLRQKKAGLKLDRKWRRRDSGLYDAEYRVAA